MTKRTIKKKIWASTCSIDEAEAAFHWVTNAPFLQWRTRLWCVLHRGSKDYQTVYDWITSA